MSLPENADVNYIELLDERRAAEILGVSERTLQGWRFRTSEGPPFIKLGRNGRIRYNSQQLTDWLESNTRTSTSDQGAEA